MQWGLLGPEILPHERRVRTLGLAATVRSFNEVAVPGMGGVWFGKQLLLPLLGISVAHTARAANMRVTNIEMANAVEAIACLSAYEATGWNSDPRLRGGQKLRGVSEPRFSQSRKSSFYVSQPMRMSTVEPLSALGLVEGQSERFNAMQVSPSGQLFLDFALKDFRPKNRSVQQHLLAWALGGEGSVVTSTLTEAISPLTPLPVDARKLLFDRVTTHGEGSSRRQAALGWVRSSERPDSWNSKPKGVSDDHWRDMRVGAKFFLARDAALQLLEEVERRIITNGGRSMTSDALLLVPSVVASTHRLRNKAKDYLGEVADVWSSDVASAFCEECVDDENVLTSLCKRDGRILIYRDDAIGPGGAFDYSVRRETSAEDGVDSPAESGWPPGISHRIDNLSWLSMDFKLEIDKRIGAKSSDEV